MSRGRVAAFGRGGERDGVGHAGFEVLEAGFRLQRQEGGALFVAADGAVEGVEVGLEGFADFGCEVGGGDGAVLEGGWFGGAGVGDVGFEFVEAGGEVVDGGGGDGGGGGVLVGVVGDDALEVEGSGLDHFDEVGEGAQFGGEEEDCEVVV